MPNHPHSLILKELSSQGVFQSYHHFLAWHMPFPHNSPMGHINSKPCMLLHSQKHFLGWSIFMITDLSCFFIWTQALPWVHGIALFPKDILWLAQSSYQDCLFDDSVVRIFFLNHVYVNLFVQLFFLEKKQDTTNKYEKFNFKIY